jgi:hypothetical protein
VKDGKKHTIIPMKEAGVTKNDSPKVFMVNGKCFLQQIKEEEVSFVLISKPKVVLTNTYLINMLVEIQNMLDEFADTIVVELPNELQTVRNISHYIDLISRESFPNKETYMMIPKENVDIRNQVHELLDKGLIKESLSRCVMPTILILKKYGV